MVTPLKTPRGARTFCVPHSHSCERPQLPQNLCSQECEHGTQSYYDPSYASVQGAYTAAFNEYVRQDLKYESDLPYEILTGKVRPWSYKTFENQYVNTAEMLPQAMSQEPHLKVMIANGYYDLATPFFATLDPSRSGNVNLTYCGAGHMLYTKKSCLDDLNKSMTDFYQRAVRQVSDLP